MTCRYIVFIALSHTCRLAPTQNAGAPRKLTAPAGLTLLKGLNHRRMCWAEERAGAGEEGMRGVKTHFLADRKCDFLS